MGGFLESLNVHFKSSPKPRNILEAAEMNGIKKIVVNGPNLAIYGYSGVFSTLKFASMHR